MSFDVHTLLYSATVILISFQSVIFAAITKIFAVSEGLLPEEPRLNRGFRFITLESGLVIGCVFLLLGLASSIYGLSDWGQALLDRSIRPGLCA